MRAGYRPTRVRVRSSSGLGQLAGFDIDIELLLAATAAEHAHLPREEGADQHDHHDGEDCDDTAVATTGVLGHGKPPATTPSRLRAREISNPRVTGAQRAGMSSSRSRNASSIVMSSMPLVSERPPAWPALVS